MNERIAMSIEMVVGLEVGWVVIGSVHDGFSPKACVSFSSGSILMDVG